MSEQPQKDSRPVRVLVNAIHAKSGGGVNYLRNMLPRLAEDPELELYLLIHQSQSVLLDHLDERVRICSRRFPVGSAALIWEQLVVPGIARNLGVHVTFSPANFCPLFARRNVVLLRNALAAGDHDTRLAKRIYWLVLGIMTRLSIATSRRVLAASGYARDAIAGTNNKSVNVIHYGVTEIFSSGEDVRGNDLLAVSDIYVHKNFHRLVEALAKLRERFPSVRLRIAGRPIDLNYHARVNSRIQELGLTDAVEFLGETSPEKLVLLYRRCAVFVFPSTAETFGNPLVEAMACGAPIACSNTTAIPEIVGDAALLFDALDVNSMATTIGELLADPTKRGVLSDRARRRAQSFSWERTAAETAKILKAAATT